MTVTLSVTRGPAADDDRGTDPGAEAVVGAKARDEKARLLFVLLARIAAHTGSPIFPYLPGIFGSVVLALESTMAEYTIGVESADKKAREYEIHYRLAVRRNLDYLEIFGIDLPRESRSQQLCA